MVRYKIQKPKLLGFTLIELLVVIAIIALLLSVIVPALRKAKEKAKRVICSSYEHQWGLAISTFATDHGGSLPPSLHGALYWSGWDMRRDFIDAYLLPVGDKEAMEAVSTSSGEARLLDDNIAYCPTQKMMRESAIGQLKTAKKQGYVIQHLLLGYFYLAGQNTGPNYSDNNPPGESVTFGRNNGWDLNPNGWQQGVQWLERKRVDNRYGYAPILSDVVIGITGTEEWAFYAGGPSSSHATSGGNGKPDGSNFLFINGSVQWYTPEDMDVGATLDWQAYYYRIGN